MAEVSPTVQMLTVEGEFQPSEAAEEYLPYLESLTPDDYRAFYRDMAITRRFDEECTNLQRQGQMGLWPPCHGQEAAQVGSGYGARAHDTIFPSYREHGVALVRGVDILDIVKVMRGVNLGGWDATDPKNNNFRNYTLVIGSQSLHATGYAMGVAFDGLVGTGDPEVDTAVLAYFGDGATSQGDVSEAFVFAASNQTPQVFFLQNNQWAISVPVSTQSRVPLYLRSRGFGIPSVQIDGNDVLSSYAATRKHLDDARAGRGPAFIEAVTYRIGAHTTSDDPTRYQTPEQLAYWVARDPIIRYEKYLRSQGVDDTFFAETTEQANDFASDLRRRTLALVAPPLAELFDHVYTDAHPVIDEQKAWLEAYEASLSDTAVGGGA